jgi:flagellar biosynthetic protein FliP
MRRVAVAITLLVLMLTTSGPPALGDDGRPEAASVTRKAPVLPEFDLTIEVPKLRAEAQGASPSIPPSLTSSAQTFALFALASLAPAAILMISAFVRINVVLMLLRQALGSPQVPGNQVVLALSLLLTALVMEPIGVQVYRRGIEPYASGREPSAARAWEAGVAPVKQFMIDQICRTHHEQYLWDLYDAAGLNRPGEPEPTECEQFPLRVVAPAFLLSELTTALFIGFAIYLPFLVIDLVVSAVLSAMGLFMLPPTLVALPLKLILFVLADGWMLVAGMLLRSFGTG